MKYKAVIFDFNGTLFFDNDKHVKAWNEISKLIRGKDISLEELHTQFNGVPNHKIIQYLCHDHCNEEDIRRYSYLKESYYRRFCKDDVSTFHLVDGVKEYFDMLKDKNIPFTIASASIKENIDFFVESFHLDNWIHLDTIVYDDGFYENKIMMFKEAARRLNVTVEECLIYEDSVSGIKNAYEAGCRHIVVIDSANKKEEYENLPGVIKVINHFKEV